MQDTAAKCVLIDFANGHKAKRDINAQRRVMLKSTPEQRVGIAAVLVKYARCAIHLQQYTVNVGL